mgnify:CR=1 FL=1
MTNSIAQAKSCEWHCAILPHKPKSNIGSLCAARSKIWIGYPPDTEKSNTLAILRKPARAIHNGDDDNALDVHRSLKASAKQSKKTTKARKNCYTHRSHSTTRDGCASTRARTAHTAVVLIRSIATIADSAHKAQRETTHREGANSPVVHH